MPLYIADYLADTAHLDNAASGSYLHLIMHYWQHGGLPNDDKKLRTIARAGIRSWVRIKHDVQPFFYDGWKHRRIDQELEKSNDVSKKRSAIASAMWDAKAHANGHANDMYDARALQSQSHIKDSFNGELRQERRWVPTKRIGGRLFKAGERAPAYDGQPPDRWQTLKPEDCQ